MPVHTYECPKCGNFEITRSISKGVAGMKKCPNCSTLSPWRPPFNTHFTVEGGTGAQKGRR